MNKNIFLTIAFILSLFLLVFISYTLGLKMGYRKFSNEYVPKFKQHSKEIKLLNSRIVDAKVLLDSIKNNKNCLK